MFSAASVVKDFSAQNTQVKKVDAISLERIFEENGLWRVDLLKVDCEGSEYPIFYDSPAHLFDKIHKHPFNIEQINPTPL